jgi:tRNA 2-thiouridine synthesizing protein A
MTAEPERPADFRADRELNCRGLQCPLPVLYTREALACMTTGELLLVVATDPGSVVDFQQFGRRNEAELMAQREEGGDYVFLLRKR